MLDHDNDETAKRQYRTGQAIGILILAGAFLTFFSIAGIVIRLAE